MTLQWEAPTLQFTGTGSRTRIDLTMRETLVRLGSGEYEYWIACREAWRASKTKDVSSWRKYRDFVESGRYHFVDRKGEAPYGFAEAFVALAMHRGGFTCWTGVHLFGRRPVNAERRLKNTRAVEDQLKKDGIAAPRELAHDLTPALKNPDVVAYHSRRKEWRFCEVKRTERVQPGQIAGLAVLHLLTGGAVTIVRLVPDKDFVPQEHEARVLCSTRSQVLTAAFPFPSA